MAVSWRGSWRGSWRVRVVGTMVVGLIGFGSPAFAGTTGQSAPDRDALVDQIVQKADPDRMEVVVTQRDDEGTPTFRTVQVDSKADARNVVDRLLGAPGVVGVEMNQPVTVALHKKKCKKYKKRKPAKYQRCRQRYAHGDPLFGQQWALGGQYLDFATVKAITAADTRRPVVAVIDTGISVGHPDLAGRVIAQANFVPGEPADDLCGHGTHVAGIVAAIADNGVGIAGLSRTAVLQSVKVLGANCDGYLSQVASGVVWAVDNGADVLNLSIEADGSTTALQSAIAYALERGRVVVAAAGNDSCTNTILGPQCSTTYPAAYAGVIGVAASTQSNTRATFSDFGTWVDVAAPGQGIVSTFLNNGYASESGTSMATPYASALAALLISHCGWSGTAVTYRILQTASHASARDDFTGYGVIRPREALTCV